MLKYNKIKEEIKKLNNYIKNYNNFFEDCFYINESKTISFIINNPFPQKLKLNKIYTLLLIREYLEYKKLYSRAYFLKNKFNNNIIIHNSKINIVRINEFKKLFDGGIVEGKYLDDEQINSIVNDSNNTLILAGAGSGKTTLIIGKIKYLLKTKQINPKDILVLSFTNASTEDMKNRLLKEIGVDINVMTFHKFGLEIIKYYTNELNVYNDDLNKFLCESINKRATSNINYLRKLIKLVEFINFNYVNEFSFKTENEYNDYLKINPPTTLNKEIVKSYGEVEIANFLFKNGISYTYEDRYKGKNYDGDKPYYPDFHINNTKIYIEYFGIDKNGNVPSYFKGTKEKTAKEIYNETILWKKETHKKNNTILIDCYAYEKYDNTLISKLKEELIKNNIVLKEKNDISLWNEINKNDDILKVVAKMFETIINLMKSKNVEFEYFNNKNLTTKDLLILSLLKPIYNDYKKYLQNENLIDFNDMINLGTKFVKNGHVPDIYKFKYIFVDEYQDISFSRYNLLRCLREKNYFNLFCVGDDFQSIYRFNGSDISLITDFENYWGNTDIYKITTTYRFSSKLADISGAFIMKNPMQIRKNIKGFKDKRFPISFINSIDEEEALQKIKQQLFEFEKDSTVYFLGRYKFDVEIFLNDNDFVVKQNRENDTTNIVYNGRKDLKITFLTIHKSKGLQADYVFIINNKNSKLGFPCRIVDDNIINVLLENKDNYEFAEERRLMYVAMTRSKNKTIFLVNRNNKSIFISEIEKIIDIKNHT